MKAKLIKLKSKYGIRLKGTNLVFTKVWIRKENLDKYEVLKKY